MATQVFALHTLQATNEWFRIARAGLPSELKPKVKQTQLGCHIEEVAEMLEQMTSNGVSMEKKLRNAHAVLHDLAEQIKAAAADTIKIKDRKLFLDSLVDQLVTATGTGFDYGFAMLGALGEVNRANFSKYVNNEPVYNADYKITKGPDYTAPNLEPFA